MDLNDVYRAGVPLAAFVGGVSVLLYFWPRPAQVFLEKKRKRAQLVDIVSLSHDTKRYRFSLGGSKTLLGLPVGKHIILYAPNPKSCLESRTWNGQPDPDKGKEEIERKYTPVTGNETPGYFELVLKTYSPGTVKMPDGREMKWADGGKMSQYLASRNIGDWVDISGPVGIHEYLGRGSFKVPGRTVTVKQVGCMAGGTGITPMIQVVSAALRDSGDRTTFSLIYANKTEDDILCKDLLEELVESSKGRFKVTYTLDFPPEGWTHKKGFITADMIKECLPGPGDDTLMMMCGPPPMVEFACKKNLETLGYPKTAMVSF
eukprot:TRINITY_DN38144_c0_g1_i1.p2 TRINITY_DN38144_c0_g1~~TRINITY_DN38144_c0_g1_i1.p2  ORF type:complete len:318 (-),score=82.36 TRINITY_DN38144_c0_g1_i1:312-1265(-)